MVLGWWLLLGTANHLRMRSFSRLKSHSGEEDSKSSRTTPWKRLHPTAWPSSRASTASQDRDNFRNHRNEVRPQISSFWINNTCTHTRITRWVTQWKISICHRNWLIIILSRAYFYRLQLISIHWICDLPRPYDFNQVPDFEASAMACVITTERNSMITSTFTSFGNSTGYFGS